VTASILNLRPRPTKTWAKIVGLVFAVLMAVAFILGGLFASPARAAASYSTDEIAFVQLLNDYRVSNGLQPLLVSDAISEACDRHNSDMGKYGFFDHYTVSSDWFAAGASPWDRMAASGYDYNTYKGENIAAGYSTAAAVFEGWRNSPGHNANMLNGTFSVIGVSVVYVGGSPYGFYWTTDFGGYVDSTSHSVGSSPVTTSTTQAPATTTTQAPTTTTQAPVTTTSSPTTTTSTSTTTTTQWTPPSTTTTVQSTTTTAARPTTTTTVVPQTTTTTIAPAPPVTFTDVDPASPYAADIAALYEQGVISGFGDGSFGPDRPVTRQQFAKMIVLALGYHVSPLAASGFRDVDTRLDPNDPGYPSAYIAVCAATGITVGKTADMFGPYDLITRAQLITMVARAGDLPNAPAGYVPAFGNFDANHYPWAVRASAAGLLDGVDGIGPDYNFWKNATRAEVCVLLANLLDR
jgi:uncharacterized protein YkwD